MAFVYNYWAYFRVDRNKYQIQIPLPPKIDPSVTMMTVEEKPDVTYNDVGGCKEQIEKMREVCIASFFTLLNDCVFLFSFINKLMTRKTYFMRCPKTNILVVTRLFYKENLK